MAGLETTRDAQGTAWASPAQAGNPAYTSLLPPVHWCWPRLQGSCLSTCAPSPALQLSSKQQPPPSPIELRWSYLNVEGAWPEVLRRYIMVRAGPAAPRLLVSEAVQDACLRLGQQSVTSLSADEHLALLR